MTVMTEVRRVGVLKAARMLDMDGGEVYQLIFGGQLDALPTREHGVLVSVDSIEQWLREHPRTMERDR